MKKFICAVILAILVFVMCSCNSAENPNRQITSLSQAEIGRNDSQEKPKMPADVEYYDFNFTLFSFFLQERDAFSAGCYDTETGEYNPENIYKKYKAPTDCINIRAKDYYTKDSTGYELLNDTDIILRCKGNDEPVIPKVTYKDYTKDTTRQPKQEWIDYFEKAFYEKVGEFNTPIIIKKSWSAMYNGVEIDIVNCDNFVFQYEAFHAKIDYENLKKVEKVSFGNNVLYNTYAIFCNGEVAYKGWIIIDEITTEPISESNEVSFALPEKELFDKCTAIPYFVTSQYDEKGQIIESPIFVTYDALQHVTEDQGLLILDMDKDDNLDIVTHRNGSGIRCITIIDEFDIESGQLIRQSAF